MTPPAVTPPAPVSASEGGATPPAVILGTPLGVSGIQRNKGNHLGTPAKHQQGLTGEKRLRLPPGTRRTMLPPPAVILGTPPGVSGIQSLLCQA